MTLLERFVLNGLTERGYIPSQSDCPFTKYCQQKCNRTSLEKEFSCASARAFCWTHSGQKLAKMILTVISKQQFADFYKDGGMFENFIKKIQAPYPTEEEIINKIIQMM
jgi:hypothetical protein